MVALAIGTVIILGAGKIFITTFQTFDKVRELSRKQESLVFITGVMIQDIRSAINVDVESDAAAIGLLVSSAGSRCDEDENLEKRYFLSEKNGKFSLSVSGKCDGESDSSYLLTASTERSDGCEGNLTLDAKGGRAPEACW